MGESTIEAERKLLQLREAAEEGRRQHEVLLPQLRQCQEDPARDSEIEIGSWIEQVVELDKKVMLVRTCEDELKTLANDTSETMKETIYAYISADFEKQLKRMELTVEHCFFLVQRRRLPEATLRRHGVVLDVYGRVRTAEFAETRRMQPPRGAKRTRIEPPSITPHSTNQRRKQRRTSQSQPTPIIQSQVNQDQEILRDSDHGSEYLSGSEESDVEMIEETHAHAPKHTYKSSSSSSSHSWKRRYEELCARMERFEANLTHSQPVNSYSFDPRVDHRYPTGTISPNPSTLSYPSQFRRHTTQEDFDLHCLRSEVVEGRLVCRCEPNTIHQTNSCSGSGTQELDKYSGKSPAEWKRFVASFNAMVGLNPRYPPVVKYNILKQKVEYRDEKMIEDRNVTSKSYARSWAWLHEAHAKPMSCLRYIRMVLTKINIRADRASLPEIRKMWDGVSELKEAGYDMYEEDLRRVIMGTLSTDLRLHIRSSAEVGKLGGYRNIAADDLAREIFDYVTAEVEDRDAMNMNQMQYRPQQLSGSRPHPYRRERREGMPRPTPHIQTQDITQAVYCYFCRGSHKPAHCQRYNTSASRMSRADERGFCNRCLKAKHGGECRIGPCSGCGQRHHTAFCTRVKPRFSGGNAEPIDRTKRDFTLALTVPSQTSTKHELPENIFMTIDIPMSKDPKGPSLSLRTCLDTHSSTNLITVEKANLLNLSLKPIKDVKLNLLGGTHTSLIRYETQAYMKINNESPVKLSFYVMEQIITPYPMFGTVPQDFDQLFKWNPEEALILRSPDVLLSLKDTLKLHPQHVQAALPSGLDLVQTKLGYIVCGGRDKEKHSVTVLATQVELRDTTPEQKCIKHLYEMEHLGVEEEDFNHTEEEIVIKQFMDDLTTDENGRYEVKLPVKESIHRLGTNRGVAYHMTEALRKRILRDTETVEAYRETFEKYLKEGIMREVEESELPEDAIGEHYLPHHPVKKQESNTTKTRIVVNPTIRSTKSGLSLNDCLYKGRPDLPNIFGILLRTRLFPILIMSDVEKAFLQLSIHPSHRPLCRLLLWRDVDKPLTRENTRVLEFQRLCFGLKPSPFVLQQALKAHILKNEPVFGPQILRDTYVDNINLMAKDDTEAQLKAERAIQLFEKAKMNLREFISNGNINLPSHLIGDKRKAKLLGIRWNTEQDELVIRLPRPNLIDKVTMANILSLIASLNDPLGLVDPLLIKMKAFFQTLWILKLKWKQEIPQEKAAEWLHLAQEWHGQEIIFPRHTQVKTGDHLHVFSDASAKALGAVVYVVDPANTHPPFLLAAKGQIAPLNKARTIPQKELAAANIAIRLVENINRELGLSLPVTSWIDNEAVLHWIKSGADNQPVAINNLLGRIWDSSVHIFRYIPTESNPADIISRGISPQELDSSKLWREGPEFLRKPEGEWPQKIRFVVEGRPIDTAKASDLIVLLATRPNTNRVIEAVYAHSSLTRAINLVSTLLRPFRLKENPSMDRVEIRRRAVEIIHRLDQKVWPPTPVQIKDLGLYEDDKGIIRSRGRISHATLPEETRHPIFIHHASPLTRMIILHTHRELTHLGPTTTLHSLRYKYWLPKGKRTVASVVRRCSQCAFWNAVPFLRPPSKELPKERVIIQPPFKSTALDMFGPSRIYKDGVQVKRWIIIFTCYTVRAIHLEVVEDCSAEEFLLAFRRFKAVRGTPTLIQSDNGSNFVGAHDLILRDNPNMRWNFTDPRSPWQNGLVERLIQTVKTALHRSKSRMKKLRDVELNTLVKEVEAAVNQRPLYPQGEHRGELQALRPVDFLSPAGYCYVDQRVGVQNVDSDPDYIPQEQRRLKKAEKAADAHPLQQRHMNLRHVLETFWMHWVESYLMNLRQLERAPRCKGYRPTTPTLGEVVMVEQPFTDREQWPLGRITAILPTTKGFTPSYVVVRVRDPRVPSPSAPGAYVHQKISIQRLYPLEPHLEKQFISTVTVDQQSDDFGPGVTHVTWRETVDPGDNFDGGTGRENSLSVDRDTRRVTRPSRRYPVQDYVLAIRGVVVARPGRHSSQEKWADNHVCRDTNMNRTVKSVIGEVFGEFANRRRTTEVSDGRRTLLRTVEDIIRCNPGEADHMQCVEIRWSDLLKGDHREFPIRHISHILAGCWIARLPSDWAEDISDEAGRHWNKEFSEWLVRTESASLGSCGVGLNRAVVKEAVDRAIHGCLRLRSFLCQQGFKQIGTTAPPESLLNDLVEELDAWRRRLVCALSKDRTPSNVTTRVVVFTTPEWAGRFRTEMDEWNRRGGGHDRRRRVIDVGGANTMRLMVQAREFVLGHEVRLVRLVLNYSRTLDDALYSILKGLQVYDNLEPNSLVVMVQVLVDSQSDLQEVTKAAKGWRANFTFLKVQVTGTMDLYTGEVFQLLQDWARRDEEQAWRAECHEPGSAHED